MSKQQYDSRLQREQILSAGIQNHESSWEKDSFFYSLYFLVLKKIPPFSQLHRCSSLAALLT